MSKEELGIEEKMRYRDLALQIRRFIKFAPAGTSKDVLLREARLFYDRVAAFEKFDRAGVVKLQRDLKRILDAHQ